MSTPKIASIKLSLTLEMQSQDQSYHMLLLSMPASQFSVHYLDSPKISSRFLLFFLGGGEPKRRADLGRRGDRMGEGGRIKSMKPGSELCISYKQAGVSDGKPRRAEHRFCSTRFNPPWHHFLAVWSWHVSELLCAQTPPTAPW